MTMLFFGWIGRQIGLVCLFGALAAAFTVGPAASTEAEKTSQPVIEEPPLKKAPTSALPPTILAL